MSDAAGAKPLQVYIIAGESSGDFLGSHLMQALKKQTGGHIRFAGVGGDKMAEEGLESLFPFHELSMMGFVEVLPYVFNILARVGLTVEDILAKRPDVIITIDSPGFCQRVVKQLREEKYQAKFIHYVAPTVWAYKPKRAERFAKLFDHLLLLLPFEPAYFEKAGLPCTFVGHPVVAESSAGNGKAFREKYQIPDSTPLFCLLPGSRKGEVERHMPIFIRVIRMLASQYPNLAIVVAAPKHVMSFVSPFFEGCPFRAVITANEQDKKDAFAASTLAIAKSGTVALEVAIAQTPMVVAYRVNPLSAWIMKRMAATKYVNLVNILEGREVIPEMLQECCTPLLVASAASQLLQRPGQLEEQKNTFKTALAKLLPTGPDSPSDIAARVVLALAKAG